MKIELKKIYTNERFSEETNCFKAEIYLNGKKVGFAENDGHGGSTNYFGIEKYYSKDIQDMEEYCKTLPPIVYTKEEHGTDFVIDMTLEHYIDNIIMDYINAKQDKAQQKKYEKGICYGKNKHSYYFLEFKQGGKKLKISDMLKSEAGKKKIIDTCREKIKEGYKILNTNIPLEI